MAGDFLESDLDTFFNLDEFAKLAKVVPVGGTEREIPVLFDEDAIMDPGIGYGQHSKVYQFEAKTSDLTGIKEFDLVIIGDDTYEIVFRTNSQTEVSTLIARKRK